MAFGRGKNKTADEAKPSSKPEQSKKAPKAKKAKKGGLLDKVGVKSEVVKSSSDVETEKMNDLLKQAWRYVRDRIDAATNDFYKTGSFEMLEMYMERPAIDATKAHLSGLRANKIYLSQPDRAKTNPKLEIVPGSVKMRGGKPEEFTVRETFSDFAKQELASSPNPEQWTTQDKLDGKQTVIEAVVRIYGGQEYKLHSVTRLEDE